MMDWQASAEGTPAANTPATPSAASSLRTHDIVRLLKLVDGNQHLFTTFAKLRQLRTVKVEELPMDDKLYITLCRLYLESIEFAEKLEACITSNLDPSLPRSFTAPKRKILGAAEEKIENVTSPKIKKKRISAYADGPKEEIRTGDDVAARIQAKDGTSQWILAKVREVRANGKYDVEDEDPGDEETQSFKKRHILTRDALILLPKELRHEFPKGTEVLAMYPQTTTFYRARVLSAPASRPKSRDYVLRFEDDDTDLRVTPHFVVAAPGE